MKNLFVLHFILLASLVIVGAGQPDYTLHEWGTFTSVSGSDGKLLPGLEREEEFLPYFVYSHDSMPQRGKGYSRPLRNVTIKMETPVIYFYAQEPFAAHVSVGFNGGSISQWFPQRSGGETPPAHSGLIAMISGADGAIDFATPYHGGIEWDVKIQPPSADDSKAVFKTGETQTWLRPRQADSALVRTADGAAEKFLFYRGLGNFPLPVKYTWPDNNTVRIQNVSQETLPALLIFNHTEHDKTTFALVDAVKAGAARSVNLETLNTSTNWEKEVYAVMRGMLVQAGLYPKEADAMLQTWWASYFERTGLRAFWIVPENFTRSILPLNVKPAPQKTVRVLVGRSELLAPAFEREMISKFSAADANPLRDDRFAFAYETRVNAMKAKH